jgi:hypothetical protein
MFGRRHVMFRSPAMHEFVESIQTQFKFNSGTGIVFFGVDDPRGRPYSTAAVFDLVAVAHTLCHR